MEVAVAQSWVAARVVATRLRTADVARRGVLRPEPVALVAIAAGARVRARAHAPSSIRDTDRVTAERRRSRSPRRVRRRRAHLGERGTRIEGAHDRDAPDHGAGDRGPLRNLRRSSPCWFSSVFSWSPIEPSSVITTRRQPTKSSRVRRRRLSVFCGRESARRLAAKPRSEACGRVLVRGVWRTRPSCAARPGR